MYDFLVPRDVLAFKRELNVTLISYAAGDMKLDKMLQDMFKVEFSKTTELMSLMILKTF